jgi:hypothetical protein
MDAIAGPVAASPSSFIHIGQAVRAVNAGVAVQKSASLLPQVRHAGF